MKRFTCLVLPALAACLAAPAAEADIYKCVTDSGQITYTNAKPSTHDKGCSLMTKDQPVSSGGGGSKKSGAAANPTPSNFPKVDSGTQKNRDNDRRKILESELDAETKALEAAKKELAEQESIRNGDEKNYQKYLDRVQPYKDTVALHQRNIDSLNKELSKLQ